MRRKRLSRVSACVTLMPGRRISIVCAWCQRCSMSGTVRLKRATTGLRRSGSTCTRVAKSRGRGSVDDVLAPTSSWRCAARVMSVRSSTTTACSNVRRGISDARLKCGPWSGMCTRTARAAPGSRNSIGRPRWSCITKCRPVWFDAGFTRGAIVKCDGCQWRAPARQKVFCSSARSASISTASTNTASSGVGASRIAARSASSSVTSGHARTSAVAASLRDGTVTVAVVAVDVMLATKGPSIMRVGIASRFSPRRLTTLPKVTSLKPRSKSVTRNDAPVPVVETMSVALATATSRLPLTYRSAVSDTLGGSSTSGSATM
mmetsp:Transcript_42957/g.132747  ORF Transcript_42957/g.132747 Transcript_42957/m.132747 type:complete len:319 (-) Transcript_42957:1400-2356(-)